MRRIINVLIKTYRFLLSPFLPPACRFTPSCSEYALQALERHNFAYAMYLSLHRLLKCHPFHPGGYDPVPGTESSDKVSAP